MGKMINQWGWALAAGVWTAVSACAADAPKAAPTTKPAATETSAAAEKQRAGAEKPKLAPDKTAFTAADQRPDKAGAAGAGAPADPMVRLREKLAERLGAMKPPTAQNPNLVQVVARSQPAPVPDAAALAARHRAEKPTAKPTDHVTATQGAAVAHDVHWSYAGLGGPDRWAHLKADFAACGSGQRQSPIDIRGGIRVDLEPIQFDYRPSGFSVIDNGHTVQVDVAPGNALEVMGRRYDLVQFHFHRPSEERIQGRQADMSVHLVHKDPEGRLAVVAVLLDRGGSQPMVQAVWNNLPLEKGQAVPARGALDLEQLLPQDRRYYTYMGSLTTPPCSEGVLWMVMAQPVSVSPDQIAVFSHLYPMNARPVQQAGGRLIKQSN
ncbi:MAG: carbonic anhydrase [Aquabacterium sp.]